MSTRRLRSMVLVAVRPHTASPRNTRPMFEPHKKTGSLKGRKTVPARHLWCPEDSLHVCGFTHPAWDPQVASFHFQGVAPKQEPTWLPLGSLKYSFWWMFWDIMLEAIPAHDMPGLGTSNFEPALHAQDRPCNLRCCRRMCWWI